jgi:hypothetical protein
LGDIYCTQGRHAKAENVLQETSDIQKLVLGCDSPEMLESPRLLATAISKQGQHAEAEKLLRELPNLNKLV